MESETGIISRGVSDWHAVRMSWHNCIQNVFAVIEFIIIFVLILISLIAMLPGLCIRERARRKTPFVRLPMSAPVATTSTIRVLLGGSRTVGKDFTENPHRDIALKSYRRFFFDLTKFVT